MQIGFGMEQRVWLSKVLSELKQLSKMQGYAGLAPSVERATEAFVRESGRASLEARRVIAFPETNIPDVSRARS